MDLEDKKYIDSGILACDELEEAFAPWKADAWFNGERNEKVVAMTPKNMTAYNNYLDNKAYEYLRNNDTNNARKCLRLMQQILAASRNKFGFNDETTVGIRNVVQHRLNEITGGEQIRNLNNQNNNRPVGGLFNPTVSEDLNEEVEIHDTLNPLIWNDDMTLKPEVEQKIKDVVQIFVDILTDSQVKIKVKDIYIVGSNANYNYNESSDLDVHIIADESFDCDQQHLPLLYNAYKTLFNKKYDISFKGVNVEIYVENEKDLSNVSSGVYSLQNGWIKEPNRNDIPEIDQEAVGQGLSEWTKRYEEITASPTIEEIDDFINEIYNLRINSIANEGEFGTGNLIFKEVRRAGILDNLKDLKTELEAKEMSLESLKEDFIIVKNKDEALKKLESCKHQLQDAENEEEIDNLLDLFNILLFQSRDMIDEKDWKAYSDWKNNVFPS